MTGRALLRRIRAHPRLRIRYDDPRNVPLGARPVLDAALDLIAAGTDPAELRAEDGDGPGDLACVLARAANAIGAEDEIRTHIGHLVRAGLLLASEDGAGLRLPVHVTETGSAKPITSSRRAEANRRNALYAVKRRDGESEESYQGRRREKREWADAQLRSQTSLVLPIDGGRLDVMPADPMIPSHARGTFGIVGHPNLGSQENVGWEGRMASATGSRAGGVGTFTTTTASNVESFESEAVVVVPDSARADGSVGIAMGSGDPNPIPSSRSHPKYPNAAINAEMVSAEAVALGAEAAGTFGWAPVHASEAPAHFERALRDGYTLAQVRAVIVDKAAVGPRCRGAKYLLQALADQAPGGASGSAGPTAAAAAEPAPAPDPDHPGVADNPDWRVLAPSVRAAISRTLRAMEIADSGECRRRLDFCRKHLADGYDLVAAVHPEVWEMQDLDPPGAEKLRATG